jgi:hypothetical protein
MRSPGSNVVNCRRQGGDLLHIRLDDAAFWEHARLQRSFSKAGADQPSGACRAMLSKLKAVWSRLAGGGTAHEPEAAPVEYKGYRIRPAPYWSKSHYQTAGTIEKETPDGLKKHEFVRADTYASRDDAIAFTITKAKQLIDQQGDRMFK